MQPSSCDCPDNEAGAHLPLHTGGSCGTPQQVGRMAVVILLLRVRNKVYEVSPLAFSSAGLVPLGYMMLPLPALQETRQSLPREPFKVCIYHERLTGGEPVMGSIECFLQFSIGETKAQRNFWVPQESGSSKGPILHTHYLLVTIFSSLKSCSINQAPFL